MSTEDTQHKYPRADAEALVSSILEEVRLISDPELLNASRAHFRSLVPFHLRSYVAAALILRTLGSSVAPARSRVADAPRGRDSGVKKREKQPPAVEASKPSFFARRGVPSDTAGTGSQRFSKGTYMGDGTTLFFSMGRRQRFTSQNILQVLSGIAGIEETDIGTIRTFDNYSFVNVHPAAADLIIQDTDGTQFKGRRLTVNRARARKEESKADARGDSPEGNPGEMPSGRRDETGEPIE